MYDPEQGQPQTNFELPVDQLQAEMALVEQYKGTAMEPVMGSYLSELKRFSGISIPKYGSFEPLTEHIGPTTIAPELTEDIGGGMVEFGSTNTPGAAVKLPVTPQQRELSTEEFDQLTDAQKSEYTATRYGEAFLGTQLPPETRMLLTDIYSLIGAQQVRDDSRTPEGQYGGRALYKGMYMGTEVYLGEHWQSYTRSDQDSVITHNSVTMYGSKAGEDELYALTIPEMDELETAGYNRFALRREGIDRRNMQQYLATAREINGIAQLDQPELTGDAALPNQERPALIDKVPKTAEDIADWKQTVELGRQMALDRARDAALSPLLNKQAELTARLSDSDRNHLKYYANAHLSWRANQLKGKGEQAQYQQQLMGQHRRDLSPAGIKILDEYTAIAEQIDKIEQRRYTEG